MSYIPFYSVLTEEFEINYLSNVRQEKSYNLHYVQDEKTLVLRNCSDEGNLIDLKQSKSVLSTCKPWVLLTLRTFSCDGDLTEVPVS